MAESDSGEKTEEPTQRRRDEYRENGQLAKSMDVLSLLVLAIGLAYFLFFGRYIFQHMKMITVFFFGTPPTVSVDYNSIMLLSKAVFSEIGLILFPLVVGVVVFGILGNVLQIGILITTKTLEPKLEKLNFFTQFIPKFFNKQVAGQLFTNLAKMICIMFIIYQTLKGDLQKITHLPLVNLFDGIDFMIERILTVIFNIVLIMIVIAIIDYAWQVWSMEEQMKMSKQEVKDEHKMTEGNPQIKGQRRKRALEMFNQRMMQAVPQADVVINNPTHFSVALRYKEGKDAAPMVVAKGADLLALRIRRLAEQHKITMVDNPQLARALYKQVKVGRSVPLEFYRAVAEVLAYVYRLRHGYRLSRQNQLSQ